MHKNESAAETANEEHNNSPDKEAQELSSESKPEQSANAEAANYRRRLRITERERDSFSSRLEALQKQVINLQIESEGYNPRGFWAADQDLAALTNDDGTVNAEAVTTALAATADQLGLAKRRQWTPDPDKGRRGTTPPVTDSDPSWPSLFDSTDQ